MKIFDCCLLSSLLALSGCLTVRETEHPQVSVPALPDGRDLRLQIAGFDATVTTYDAAYGYTTVAGSGWGGGRRGWYSGATTYSTTTFVPRTETTAYYRNRAMDAFERAGCVLKSAQPQYQVEVTFEGPFSEDGDGWATFGWMVCTVFTAEYGGQTWQAHVRIRELATGKLVHSCDLTERDESVVWGPIPIFSPAGSDRNSYGVMKGLCLATLTDRAVAAAMNFFVSR